MEEEAEKQARREKEIFGVSVWALAFDCITRMGLLCNAGNLLSPRCGTREEQNVPFVTFELCLAR